MLDSYETVMEIYASCVDILLEIVIDYSEQNDLGITPHGLGFTSYSAE